MTKSLLTPSVAVKWKIVYVSNYFHELVKELRRQNAESVTEILGTHDEILKEEDKLKIKLLKMRSQELCVNIKLFFISASPN